MATVITGERIKDFRLMVILRALKLETKGLKGKVKASVAARNVLEVNGIKPERNLLKLFVQFENYLKNNGQYSF